MANRTNNPCSEGLVANRNNVSEMVGLKCPFIDNKWYKSQRARECLLIVILYKTLKAQRELQGHVQIVNEWAWRSLLCLFMRCLPQAGKLIRCPAHPRPGRSNNAQGFKNNV